MKNNLYFAAVLTVLAAAASCQKEIEQSQDKPSRENRQVTIKAGTAGSKTSVSGGALTWSEGDKLNIVPQAGSVAAAALDIKTGVGEATGTFEGMVASSVTDETNLYGWCGGSWTYSSGSFSVNMPATQTYVSNGLAKDAYPSIGTGTIKDGISLSNPMGVLKLTIKGETTDFVKSISVTSKAKNLAGSFSIDKSSYAVSGGSSKTVTLNVADPYVALSSEGVNFYIVVPPAEYAASDLTVTVTKSDDKTISHTFADVVTITANSAKTKTLEVPKWDSNTKKIVFGTYDKYKNEVSGEPYILNQDIKIYKFEDSTSGGNHFYELSDKTISMSGSLFGFFYYKPAASVKTIVLENFDTSEVTDMSYMFSGCTSVESIVLSNFSNTKVTDMSGMFYKCTSVKSIEFNNFGTPEVTNMSSMFEECTSIESIELNNFSNTKVKNMSGMFLTCSNVKSIKLNNFGTSEVTNMKEMFENCQSLSKIYVTTFNVDKVENSDYMFSGCNSIVGGEGTTYNSSWTDKTFARIDGGSGNPGYFTAITTN